LASIKDFLATEKAASRPKRSQSMNFFTFSFLWVFLGFFACLDPDTKKCFSNVLKNAVNASNYDNLGTKLPKLFSTMSERL
jgi:hypothetical protein